MNTLIKSIALGTAVGLAAIPTVNAQSARPVVVELFESQGCSSCPPAERTIHALQKEFGNAILSIVFHVDYWDALGWKDVFSQSSFTERQRTYGERFGQSSMYTPEMVIDGELGFVGSDTTQARAAIESRVARPSPAVVMAVDRLSSAQSVVRLKMEKDAREPFFFTMVLYEDADPVKVLRGENAGVTMSGDFAVRRLTPAAPLKDGQARVTFTREPSWPEARLHAAALITSSSHQMVAAQKIDWPAQGP